MEKRRIDKSRARNMGEPIAPANKKHKKRGKYARMFLAAKLIFAVLVFATVGVFVTKLFTNAPSEKKLSAIIDEGKIIDGVTIEGVDVSGMDYATARAAVLDKVEQKKKTVNITVAHETAIWVLNAGDMGVTSTIDETVAAALMLGRSGNAVENGEVKAEVAANGRDLSVGFVADEAKLKKRLSDIGLVIDSAPTEPCAVAVTTAATPEFTYKDGADGYVLDEEALYALIVESLASGEPQDRFEPTLDFAKPTVTLEYVKENLALVSSFETSFGGSRAARNEKRVGNIQRVCTMLNGHRVENGTEFNFNGYIGPRTEAGGWPLAPGIVNGNQYEDQAGGGICQVSTTLYNALLCAGASMERGTTLEEALAKNIEGIAITERRHHSWPSAYVDKGLDSTVTGTVEEGKSLNFVNNTGADLFIFAYCDRENYTVTVFIYGKPLPAGVEYKVRGVVDRELEPPETKITYDTSQPADYKEDTITSRKGYEVTAWRDIYVNGELKESEKLYSETYNPVQGERTIGTGGAEPPAASGG